MHCAYGGEGIDGAQWGLRRICYTKKKKKIRQLAYYDSLDKTKGSRHVWKLPCFTHNSMYMPSSYLPNHPLSISLSHLLLLQMGSLINFLFPSSNHSSSLFCLISNQLFGFCLTPTMSSISHLDHICYTD